MATNDKYDRQLRLWGASGQKRLAESCIVLINATAAGTETLKNLVLPGIGKFHIIDDALVSPTKADDPLSNFFVFCKDSNHAESVPKSRAEIATQHLIGSVCVGRQYIVGMKDGNGLRRQLILDFFTVLLVKRGGSRLVSHVVIGFCKGKKYTRPAH